MKGDKDKGKQKVNVWKIVAVVFIILFCIALIAGLTRVYHTRASFSVPTQDQIDSAKDAVAQELQNKGDDINNYEIVVSKNIRKFGRRGFLFGMNGHSKNIIQVSLSKNSTRHSYLIGIDSGEVLMHTQTEFFGEIPNFVGRFGR